MNITTDEPNNMPNKKNIQIVKKLLYILGSLVIFLLIWGVFVFILNNWVNRGIKVLPTPLEVIQSFFHLLVTPIDGNTLINHVIASIIRVLMGVLYAFFIGITLGLILGSNKILDRIFQPIVEMLRPIPPIAWIPFAMITFGLGLSSNAFIIFIGAFFPIFQNTYDGVHQSKKVYQDVASSLGASRTQIITDILFPSILPNIITGLKVAVGVGWMCVIAAEMMGIDITSGGLGYFINYMKNIGNYSNMMAGMLMIAIVGLLINGIFVLIQKYALKWLD